MLVVVHLALAALMTFAQHAAAGADTAGWRHPLPAALEPVSELDGVVLVGRTVDGRFQVSEIEPLHDRRTGAAPSPEAEAQEPSPGETPPFADRRRSAWTWAPEAWQGDAGVSLLERAARIGVETLFVTVPLDAAGDAVAAPDALAAFLGEATRAGIAVWAVSGDPAAVLPKEEDAWRARAAAYAAYQAAAAPGSRLAGLQYDIEPYLLPAYARDPARWNTRLLDLFAALKAEAPSLPLDAVVPFWLLDGPTEPGTADLPTRLAGLADVVTVMAYRTDADLVADLMRPWLAWGGRTGTPVRAALEAGPLPDEEARVYRPAPDGPLRITPYEGGAVLEMLSDPAPATAGRAFALSHVVPRPAERLTFHGRMDDMIIIMDVLMERLAPWPAFAGLALHGVAALEGHPQ
ncbi:hypothetical protein C882_0212 [Caenispirillum salinarum AK4]|uniref:Uncharacterized protein n=2 Tax=Caenispirillum TaxID=414051 RepID=K9GX20_9PROT|nr:hypothetical protein C882_0212 [Caenispirillum salinarum AK4]